MLDETLESVIAKRNEREVFLRAVGTLVLAKGGRVEIPFTEMGALSGFLTVEVDRRKNTVTLCLQPLLAEEVEKELEKELEEKRDWLLSLFQVRH